MSYEEEIKFNEDFLDTLNLDPPDYAEEITDWCVRMEDKCKVIELPPELQNCLFNFMDSYDIKDYILRRFGGRADTIERIYFYGCGRR